MTKWLLLAAAICSEVTGSLSLKGALNHPALYAVVAVGYLASFTLLALVLKQGMALGVAYGIWAAAGVALTAILAKLIFNENFTWIMAAGVALIIGGVLLIELGATH